MKNFIILLFMMLSCACHAQMVSTNYLAGTKWQRTNSVDDQIVTTISFNMTEVETVTEYKRIDQEVRFKQKYYVSPSVPNLFNECFVGQNMTGQYIVEWNENMSEMIFFKVLYFSEDRLTLYHPFTRNTIGGTDEYTAEYMRVNMD